MKLQSGKSSEINWDEIEAEVQKEDNGGGWGKDVKCMNYIIENQKCLLRQKRFSFHRLHLTIQIDHFTNHLVKFKSLKSKVAAEISTIMVLPVLPMTS